MNKMLWAHHYPDLRCSRTLDAVPTNTSPMHTHDWIEIYFFISGNCTYVIEGTAYDLKPHDILFKRPLEAHMLVVNSSDVPYERMGISVPVDVFRAIDPDNTLFQSMLSRPLGTGNRFTAADFGHDLCSKLMMRMADNGGQMERMELLGIILFVASEASRVLRNQQLIRHTSDVGTRLIDYVNHHLFSELTLQMVSEEFFLSQSQINRIFKSNTGSSLHQYITVKRLLTARDRIRSGIPIAEACFDCGYNDYSVFYRAYLKQFGHPPSDDKKPTVG